MAQGVPPGPVTGLGQGLLPLPPSSSSSSTPAQFSRPAPVPVQPGLQPLENIWKTSGSCWLWQQGGNQPGKELFFINVPGRGQRGPAPLGAGLGGGQDAAEPGGSCRIPGEQRPARSPAGTSALLRPEGAGSRRAVPEKTRLILVGPGRELVRGGAETGPMSTAPKTPDPPRWALVRVQKHHVCGAGAHVQPGPAPRGETPAPSRLSRTARAARSLSRSLSRSPRPQLLG